MGNKMFLREEIQLTYSNLYCNKIKAAIIMVKIKIII